MKTCPYNIQIICECCMMCAVNALAPCEEITEEA